MSANSTKYIRIIIYVCMYVCTYVCTLDPELPHFTTQFFRW